MKTEKEKMLQGELYDAGDPQLAADRLRARDLCYRFNTLAPTENDSVRNRLLAQLFGARTDVYITPPFYCDYGTNIVLGEKVYFNFNCVVLDVTRVVIGDRVMFGPGVQILTASHPMDPAARRAGKEYGKPITIGDDAWIGGGVIICPGVTIGPETVIGAGSVVTRDIEASVFAAGNPCRVIRKLI